MGCNECEKEQETKEKEYFFRIDNGNILVFGCEKHIAKLQKIIRGDNEKTNKKRAKEKD